MRHRLQEQFNEMAKASFGNVSDTQYNDMRRSFMGGAKALLRIIMGELSPGMETTETDLKLMHEVDAELKLFVEAVKRGEK